MYAGLERLGTTSLLSPFLFLLLCACVHPFYSIFDVSTSRELHRPTIHWQFFAPSSPGNLLGRFPTSFHTITAHALNVYRQSPLIGQILHSVSLQFTSEQRKTNRQDCLLAIFRKRGAQPLQVNGASEGAALEDGSKYANHRALLRSPYSEAGKQGVGLAFGDALFIHLVIISFPAFSTLPLDLILSQLLSKSIST